jgi:hypothetical protein
MSKNLKQAIPDESRAKKFFPSDLTLLSELDEDAKQPLSQLAKKPRISQQLLSYRQQLLKKRRILGAFYTKIHFPTSPPGQRGNHEEYAGAFKVSQEVCEIQIPERGSKSPLVVRLANDLTLERSMNGRTAAGEFEGGRRRSPGGQRSGA